MSLFSPPSTGEPQAPIGQLTPGREIGSLWRRIVAVVIDSIIVGIAGTLVALPFFDTFSRLVLRPLDYVTKLVSGLLACKLPLDGNPVAIHTTIPGPSLLAQASDVSDSAFA